MNQGGLMSLRWRFHGGSSYSLHCEPRMQPLEARYIQGKVRSKFHEIGHWCLPMYPFTAGTPQDGSGDRWMLGKCCPRSRSMCRDPPAHRALLLLAWPEPRCPCSVCRSSGFPGTMAACGNSPALLLEPSDACPTAPF